MQDLENRIKALERSCMKWRWMAAALTLLLGVVIWFGCSQTSTRAEAQPGREGQVVDYFIVPTQSKSATEKAVKDSLKNGWEPLGGVAFKPNMYSYEDGWYSQALVKRR